MQSVLIPDQHEADTRFGPLGQGGADVVRNRAPDVVHHGQVANTDGASVEEASNALPSNNTAVGHARRIEVEVGPRPSDGIGDGVRAVLLEVLGEGKQGGDVAAQQFDVGDARPSFRDCPCFVQHDRIDVDRSFEVFDALHKDAKACAHARAHHERGWGGEAKRARAGDHQGGHKHQHDGGGACS